MQQNIKKPQVEEAPIHPVINASVVALYALVDGFLGALKAVRWLWRWTLHLTFYGRGPGSITLLEPTETETIDGLLSGKIVKGAILATALNGYKEPEHSYVANLYFRVSNPIYLQKERLSHEEAAELVNAVRQASPMPAPADTLVWKGISYRYVDVPSLNLRRYPDDITLRAERRWEANAAAA